MNEKIKTPQAAIAQVCASGHDAGAETGQTPFEEKVQAALIKSIGQSEAFITTQARGAVWSIRVISRDGVPKMGIQNLDVQRLNLTVVDGIVTGISRG